MAEAAHAPEMTTQLIKIGIIIITQSTIFSSNIPKWQDNLTITRLGPTSKTISKLHRKPLNKVSPPSPHILWVSTNRQRLRQALSIRYLKIWSAQNTNQDAAITAEMLTKQQMQPQLLNMANSSQQNQHMLHQMTALATTFSTLQTQLNSNNQDQGNRQG
jgi:hypothetical protein